MTDSELPRPGDLAVQNTVLETSERARIWRFASIGLAALGFAVCLIWILQARSAGDVAAERNRTLAVTSADVTVQDLAIGGEPTFAVLGIDASDRVALGENPSDLTIPTTVSSIMAVYDGDSLVGLQYVTPGAAGQVPAIVISPNSTARVLLTLAPGFLSSDIDRTLAGVNLAAGDPAFAELVAAITAEPGLSDPNATIEEAVAAILDRLSVGVTPDQGCDSVLSNAARAVTGSCITFGGSGPSIANHQQRWATLFTATAEPSPCGAAAPADTRGSDVSIDTTRCGAGVVVAAPGPVPTKTPQVTDLVRAATAVHVLGEYVTPFADLVGGSAGAAQVTAPHILASIEVIVDAADQVIDDDPVVPPALDLITEPATRAAHHQATAAIARSLLESDRASTFVPNWDPRTSAHSLFLDFYDRVAQHMSEPGPVTRWAAPGFGQASLEADS